VKVIIRLVEIVGFCLVSAIMVITFMVPLLINLPAGTGPIEVLTMYLLAVVTVDLGANLGLLVSAGMRVDSVRIGFGPRLATITRPLWTLEVRLVPLYLSLRLLVRRATRARASMLEAYGGAFAVATVAAGILAAAIPGPWRPVVLAGSVLRLAMMFLPIRRRGVPNTGARALALLVAKDVSPEFVGSLAARAIAKALIRGDLVEAKENLNAVHLLGEERITARLRAAVLHAEGDWAGAAELLQPYLADEPHTLCTHAYLILVATEADQLGAASSLPMARASLDQARQLNCPGPQADHDEVKALLLVFTGDYREATACARRAVATATGPADRVDRLCTLAHAAAGSGDAHGARMALKQARRLLPSSPRIASTHKRVDLLLARLQGQVG
jgi:hypothetical protein